MSTIIIITTPPKNKNRTAEDQKAGASLEQTLQDVVDQLRALDYDIEVQRSE